LLLQFSHSFVLIVIAINISNKGWVLLTDWVNRVSTNKKSPKPYKDLIDFTPHFIMNINSDQRALISKHHSMVALLNESPRTVKELHNLLTLDKDTDTKTLKTIYRYISELEEARLVVNCGQRMTKGSRIIEQVFSLSSHHFYYNEPTLEWWETEEAHKFTDNLSELIGKILDDDRFAGTSSKEIIHQLCKVEANAQYFNTLDIVQKIQRDSEIKAIFPADYSEQNRMIEFGARILTYLKNFEEYKLLTNIVE